VTDAAVSVDDQRFACLTDLVVTRDGFLHIAVRQVDIDIFKKVVRSLVIAAGSLLLRPLQQAQTRTCAYAKGRRLDCYCSEFVFSVILAVEAGRVCRVTKCATGRYFDFSLE